MFKSTALSWTAWWIVVVLLAPLAFIALVGTMITTFLVGGFQAVYREFFDDNSYC